MQSKDNVLEARTEGFSDCIMGVAGMVVGDRQMNGSGDRGGVAANLSIEVAQESASMDGVIDVAAGDIPQIGILGGHAQRRDRASTDQYRWIRLLDGFGVTERPGKVEVGVCRGVLNYVGYRTRYPLVFKEKCIRTTQVRAYCISTIDHLYCSERQDSCRH